MGDKIQFTVKIKSLPRQGVRIEIDVNQIFGAIENAVKDAKKKFSAQDTEKTTKFSLKK